MPAIVAHGAASAFSKCRDGTRDPPGETGTDRAADGPAFARPLRTSRCESGRAETVPGIASPARSTNQFLETGSKFPFRDAALARIPRYAREMWISSTQRRVDADTVRKPFPQGRAASSRYARPRSVDEYWRRPSRTRGRLRRPPRSLSLRWPTETVGGSPANPTPANPVVLPACRLSASREDLESAASHAFRRPRQGYGRGFRWQRNWAL